jgi:Fe2+ or Zn2+ uptake regulation protein
LFNQFGLRCTEQRLALYETLRGCCSHPTAEELYHLARSRIERLSLATVYNTLEVLCGAGLAKKFPMGNGCCRYDADTSEHPHVRFREDSSLQDVPDGLGQRLLQNLPGEVIREIEEELGIQIDGVNIQLIGRRANGR